MLTILGFTATALIVVSQILLGWKKRYSFILAACGNAIWMFVAIERTPWMLDLALASLFFCILSVRNFILWGKRV